MMFPLDVGGDEKGGELLSIPIRVSTLVNFLSLSAPVLGAKKTLLYSSLESEALATEQPSPTLHPFTQHLSPNPH